MNSSTLVSVTLIFDEALGVVVVFPLKYRLCDEKFKCDEEAEGEKDDDAEVTNVEVLVLRTWCERWELLPRKGLVYVVNDDVTVLRP
jgi:hypothetical protein